MLQLLARPLLQKYPRGSRAEALRPRWGTSIPRPALVCSTFSTYFYSAPLCKRCTGYGNSVCLSVRHTPVLCQFRQ